jgi:hypothetical protein
MSDKHLTIPRMPDLWSMDKLYVGHKALKGALAHWAVYQSQVVAPANLEAAVAQFMKAWPHRDLAQMSSQDLHAAVREAFERCPLILAWNERTPPTSDFIDRGALARNITHDVVLWEQVECAQDKVRAA